jgi:trimeric autotransporter adhesin
MNLVRSTTRTPLTSDFFVALVFAFCVLSPRAYAVTPAPDGGYPNGNTAEGTNALFSLSGGIWNTALGANALYGDITGGGNTATGVDSLFHNNGNGNVADGVRALFSNISGSSNTAVGFQALNANISGSSNTAMGFQALINNDAYKNVAVGYQALKSNLIGSGNTATGYQALYSNTSDIIDGVDFGTGFNNTANGQQALFHNTTASYNTAIGSEALFYNTTGSINTATGAGALWKNTDGEFNTANGGDALLSNTTGGLNTATGGLALSDNTTGIDNTANGFGALASNTIGNSNTATGLLALEQNTTGSFNIALGYFAGILTTGSNNIDIGNLGVADEANTIRIGNVFTTTWSDGLTHPAQTRTFIAGIRGRATANANAIPVLIDGAGQLGTASSSARFKNEIKPMDKTSEAILGLKPVTFHYKSDNTGTPQFGLIAEEVAKVNPDLVVRDENGEIYTVRYEAVNAMLLNEFLKEHRRVQKLEAALAAVNERLKEQDAKIDKVNAKVELTKPAQQVVNNNQ